MFITYLTLAATMPNPDETKLPKNVDRFHCKANQLVTSSVWTFQYGAKIETYRDTIVLGWFRWLAAHWLGRLARKEQEILAIWWQICAR